MSDFGLRLKFETLVSAKDRVTRCRTSDAADLSVAGALAVAPLALVLQARAGVHVAALAVAQVVLPFADVLVAVGVVVVATASATIVRPLACVTTPLRCSL